MTWHPTLKVEIGFGASYTTDPVTWTDVTAYVFESEGIAIRRQRQRELDRIEAGVATFALRNDDERFSIQNSAGPYYGFIKLYMPVRIRATYSATTYDLYRGFVESWDPEPDQERSIVRVGCVDGLKMLNLWPLTVSYTQELSSVRVSNVLDSVSWPAGLRDIETGIDEVQSIDLVESLALVHLQAVVDSEFGVLFVDGAGNIVFQNRAHRSTFSDKINTFGGAGLKYKRLGLTFDDRNLWNYISVQVIGGIAQIATDATSQASYGLRALPARTNLLMIHDSDALNQAEWLLYRYKDPMVAIDELEIAADDSSALLVAMLAREVGDRIRVIRTQVNEDYDLEEIIESVSHDIRQKGADWVTTWRLSPAEYWAFWTVEYSSVEVDTVVGY